MADFGSPVASTTSNPTGQAVQTLSGLLSLQQQRQALAGQAADVQQAQQTANQRAHIATFMQSFDPTKHVGSDGTLDLDEVLTDPKLRAAAGDQFPQIMQTMIQAKQGQLANKQSLANLNGELRNQFSSTVGSLRTDPEIVKDTPEGRAKVQQALGDFAETGGPDAARIADVYQGVIQHVPPGKLSQALSNFQLQAMDASTQAGRQAPSYTDVGGKLQQTNPQAAGGAPNGDLEKGIPPGAFVVEDAFHRKFVLNPKTNSVVPLGEGGGENPSTNAKQGGGYTQPVANQQQVLDSIENTRAIGDTAPSFRNTNSQLLRLSKETMTGPATQTLQKVAAIVGLPSGSNYQEISAYLDRQAAMQARAMGVPNTNAGLAAAASASGTTEYTPKALQEKVKFADAMNSGAIAYRQGLDKSVGTGPTPDLSKYQSFRSAWTKNYDPDIFRAEDAQRRGDTEELESLKKRLGKKGMADLATKSANLRQLENGQIPNE